MSKLRVHSAPLETPPRAPKLRIHALSISGVAPLAPRLRIHGAAMTGPAAVLLSALPDQTVEPESTVTIAASLVGGGSPDSWTFRRVSGPSVGISGTGATRTFTAPSAMPPAGASVVIGVTATIGGVTSPERTCTITVLPQVSWVWTGTEFVGSRKTYIVNPGAT
nr:hypothetical protein [Sphaerisporangium cinnabarinum]